MNSSIFNRCESVDASGNKLTWHCTFNLTFEQAKDIFLKDKGSRFIIKQNTSGPSTMVRYQPYPGMNDVEEVCWENTSGIFIHGKFTYCYVD